MTVCRRLAARNCVPYSLVIRLTHIHTHTQASPELYPELELVVEPEDRETEQEDAAMSK